MKRDLRKYARQTNIRLVVGAVLLVFLIGDGLIYLLYGKSAAVGGLLCLAIGLVPVILVVLVLLLLDYIRKKADHG